jgi:hypothetical protein
MPDYLKNLSLAQTKTKVYEHISHIVQNYCQGFDLFEIATGVEKAQNLFGFTREEMYEILKEV